MDPEEKSQLLHDSRNELILKSKNEDLVLFDDDSLFNNKLFNNRWFHTPNTNIKSNLVNCETDLLMLSPLVFHELSMFAELKRVKVSQITDDQLKKFEQVPGLEHLEIGLLLVDQKSDDLLDPIRLPALKRLYINQIDFPEFLVPFDTDVLEAVYFGSNTINRVHFQNYASITHCEFEFYEFGDEFGHEFEFTNLQTLACHRILDDDNLNLVVRVAEELPSLAELHCSFDGLTSLTNDYSHFDRQLIRKTFTKLSKLNWRAEFWAGPQVYLQSVPLLEHIINEDRFYSPAIELQLALIQSEASEAIKWRVCPSFVHADLPKLLALRLKADAQTHAQFHAKFPNLQEFDFDFDFDFDLELQNHSMFQTNVEQFLFYLGNLCGVSKLVFSRCHTELNQTSFLQVLNCLADSLIALKIFEQLSDTLLSLKPTFLKKLKHLRYFGTNLVCKDLICFWVDQIDTKCMFTFSFHFETGHLDQHVAIIRKVGHRYELTILERNHRGPVDTDRRFELGSDLSPEMLKLKLANDPTCARLLRHEFDRLLDFQIQAPTTKSWFESRKRAANAIAALFQDQFASSAKFIVPQAYGQSASSAQHYPTSTYSQASLPAQHYSTPAYGQSASAQQSSTSTYGQSASSVQHYPTSMYGQSASAQHYPTSTYSQASLPAQHYSTPAYGQSASSAQHYPTSMYGQAASAQHYPTSTYSQASLPAQHYSTPAYGQSASSAQHYPTSTYSQAGLSAQHYPPMPGHFQTLEMRQSSAPATMPVQIPFFGTTSTTQSHSQPFVSQAGNQSLFRSDLPNPQIQHKD